MTKCSTISLYLTGRHKELCTYSAIRQNFYNSAYCTYTDEIWSLLSHPWVRGWPDWAWFLKGRGGTYPHQTVLTDLSWSGFENLVFIMYSSNYALYVVYSSHLLYTVILLVSAYCRPDDVLHTLSADFEHLQYILLHI